MMAIKKTPELKEAKKASDAKDAKDAKEAKDAKKNTTKEELTVVQPAPGNPARYTPYESTPAKRRFFWQRENVFLKLIHDQAAITSLALEALVGYMNNQDPECAKALTAREKEADEARRILINELNKTFITPFDREDIFELSRTIDDVLDYAYSTMTEMEILRVKPTPYMANIASLLRDAAFELLQAVDRLEKHPGVASEHAQRAKALENRVEAVYREALADLFSGAEDIKHVIKMLKLREVYRHLSNAADRGDEAANVIADIVVKMT